MQTQRSEAPSPCPKKVIARIQNGATYVVAVTNRGMIACLESKLADQGPKTAVPNFREYVAGLHRMRCGNMWIFLPEDPNEHMPELTEEYGFEEFMASGLNFESSGTSRVKVSWPKKPARFGADDAASRTKAVPVMPGVTPPANGRRISARA
jgi:hypothetical protein